MAESVYEGLFILDANQYGRDAEKVSGQISRMIEQAGGTIMVSRLWEERRLAYPIQGHRRGAYWLTYFRVNGDRLPEIQRRCELSDSILRSLMLKVDPRIVDTLVAHARETPERAAAESESEEKGPTAAKTGESEKQGEAEKQPAAAEAREG